RTEGSGRRCSERPAPAGHGSSRGPGPRARWSRDACEAPRVPSAPPAIGSDLHMDYTAVGQATHLAARMEQFANPGSILLTPSTLELAEGFAAVKSLGPVPVKGLADAMEVYEATGTGPARTKLQAAARRGLTRFVGRGAETEQLRAALEKAGQAQGQVIAVVGEPGVGKSRLFYEFSRSHRTQRWL